jgi:hypothetical protein
VVDYVVVRPEKGRRLPHVRAELDAVELLDFRMECDRGQCISDPESDLERPLRIRMQQMGKVSLALAHPARSRGVEAVVTRQTPPRTALRPLSRASDPRTPKVGINRKAVASEPSTAPHVLAA